MILLVVIVSYAMHVSCHPYMAVGMEEAIINRHRELALKGHPLHSRIRANLIPVFHLMRVNTKKKNRWNPSGAQMSALKKSAGNIFFDYNTVESVLLFCAILVAIAGIMFTSGQLSSSGESADSALVTWILVFVVLFSIGYFIAVFIAELYVVFGTPKEEAPKPTKKGEKPDTRARKSISKPRFMEAEDTVVTAAVNPLFMNAGGDGTPGKMSAQSTEHLQQSVEVLMADHKPPDSFNWEMFKVTFAELRRETKQLEGRLADKQDSKKQDSKKQAEVATRLAALRATPRRRFSQLRATDEAST